MTLTVADVRKMIDTLQRAEAVLRSDPSSLSVEIWAIADWLNKLPVHP